MFESFHPDILARTRGSLAAAFAHPDAAPALKSALFAGACRRFAPISPAPSQRPPPRQDAFNVCCDLHKVFIKFAPYFPDKPFPRQETVVRTESKGGDECCPPAWRRGCLRFSGCEIPRVQGQRCGAKGCPSDTL